MRSLNLRENRVARHVMLNDDNGGTEENFFSI